MKQEIKQRKKGAQIETVEGEAESHNEVERWTETERAEGQKGKEKAGNEPEYLEKRKGKV